MALCKHIVHSSLDTKLPLSLASSKRGVMWPFPGDMPYFFGLWLMSTITLGVVLAVEAYAIYLIISGMNGNNNYGINGKYTPMH